MWKSTGHQIFNRQTIVHLGVLAVYEEGLHTVGDEDEELRHLQLGQVLLPPQGDHCSFRRYQKDFY